MSNNKPSFHPINRHIQIEPHDEDQKTLSGVLLPEDYSPDKQKYITATVLAISSDCSSPVKQALSGGSKIIIDRSMAEEIVLSGNTYHIILENYIVGSLREKNEN